MLRTTVVGSWPPAPTLHDDLQRYHRGEIRGAAADELLRAAASSAIAEQRACGLEQYTGGETAADTFILHFPACLSGVARTDDQDAWDGRGTYAVVGPIDAPEGLGIAAAYAREHALDSTIDKVTFPGPSEITMRIEPQAAREAIWPNVVQLIRREMQGCIALGATDLQLDLPHIAMGLADQRWGWTTERAAALIGDLFDGFGSIRRSIHLCYGDFEAQTWTQQRAFHPLLPLIQALDGTIDRVVLEFSLPEQWTERHLLAAIPCSMEIAAGIIDVKSPAVETIFEIEAKIEALLHSIPAERLLICPSCGFGRRHRELAIAKTTAMVQAVRAVNDRLSAT